MKLIRKFGIYCACLFTVIAFVLLMATPALNKTVTNPFTQETSVEGFAGTTAIFGNEYFEPSGIALTAWILVLVAILGIAFLIVVPFIKALKLDPKLLGLIALGVALLLVVAAILAFLPCVGYNVGAGVGIGWAFAGILLFLAACGLACDPLLTILGK